MIGADREGLTSDLQLEVKRGRKMEGIRSGMPPVRRSVEDRSLVSLELVARFLFAIQFLHVLTLSF